MHSFFKLKALEDTLRAMQTLLLENECQSNPCQNGGTCEDLYDAYQCHCPSNWEVRECRAPGLCRHFAGIIYYGGFRDRIVWRTSMNVQDFSVRISECQNGAKCRNLPGSYRYATTVSNTSNNTKAHQKLLTSVQRQISQSLSTDLLKNS